MRSARAAWGVAALLGAALAAAPAHAGSAQGSWPAGPLTELDEDPACFQAPYVYGGLGEALVASFSWALATGLPHVGLRASDGARDIAPLSAQVSWPWSLPLGAPKVRFRPRRCARLQTFFAHRLLLEPGVQLSSQPEAFLRPGYRYVWHPRGAAVGAGFGVGASLLVRLPGGAFDVTAGPELVLHVGRCCAPGFLLLALRYERAVREVRRQELGVSAGVAFF